MGRALTILFGLLAFALLVWVCLGHQTGIQKEIAENARAALLANGHEFAQASAAGQTIVLRGTADSESQRTAAAETVLGVDGVLAVDNQIALLADVPPPGPDSSPIVSDVSDVSEVAQPPAIEPIAAEPATDATVTADTVIAESLQVVLEQNGQRAQVVGLALAYASDDADDDANGEPARIEQIEESIRAVLSGWEVSQGLSATANTPTDLSLAVKEVLPLLVRAERAQLDADAGGIRVDAKLASFADRSALENALESLDAKDSFAESNLSWLLDSPPPNADSCQKAFDQLLGADSIMFTTNRAEIRPGSIGLLGKLVEVATDCNVTVEVEGHTDSRGSDELNLALSQARADSVRDFLIDKGVDGQRVSAKGFGSVRPIADNNTVNGRQANRRIEFRVQRNDQ